MYSYQWSVPKRVTIPTGLIDFENQTTCVLAVGSEGGRRNREEPQAEVCSGRQDCTRAIKRNAVTVNDLEFHQHTWTL